MTVTVTQPSINVREKLAELDKPTGIAGEAMLRAETPQEQFNLIGAGRRNIINNGDMQVAQRSTSTAIDNSASRIFSVDRFYFGTAGLDQLAGNLLQSSEAPDGFAHSLKLAVTTGETTVDSGEYAYIGLRFEAQDMQRLAYGTSSAKDLTLSFWVKSSETGTYGLSLYCPDGPRILQKPYTINSANTWEYKTILIEGDSSGTIDDNNGEGYRIAWHLAAGSSYTGTARKQWGSYSGAAWAEGHEQDGVITTSNATFNLTGVQLEVGKVATPFEHRSYGEELALCQRYYYKIQGGTTEVLGIGGNCESTTSAFGSTFFPVTMRTTPTSVEQSGDATDYRVFHSATTVLCSAVPTFNGATTASIGVTNFTVASGLTANRPAQVGTANSDGYLAWSAEL